VVVDHLHAKGAKVQVLTLLQLLRCRVRGQAVRWSRLLGQTAVIGWSALVNQLYTTASAAAVVPINQTFAVQTFLLCEDN
jgi:hypothetical protein